MTSTLKSLVFFPVYTCSFGQSPSNELLLQITMKSIWTAAFRSALHPSSALLQDATCRIWYQPLNTIVTWYCQCGKGYTSFHFIKEKKNSSFLNLHQEQSCGVSPASFSHCWHLSKSMLCWDQECDCVTPRTGCNLQLRLEGAVQRPRLSLWVGPSDRATWRGRTWSTRPRVCFNGSVTVGRVSFIGTTALPCGKCTDPLGGKEVAGVFPSGQAF